MYGYNFNNYQPSYQPSYQQPSHDDRIWVQNQTSAEAYLVAPNSFVRLWDSSKPVFYEKKTDATGRPMPIEVFEYARQKPQEASLVTSGAIDYSKEIKALSERIEALAKKGAKTNAKKSIADDTTVQTIPE